MYSIDMTKPLEKLLQNPGLWQASRLHGQPGGSPVLATGIDALDNLLHRGGLPADAITETLLEQAGIGELRLLLRALQRNTGDRRNIFIIAPPYIPFAPALQQTGLAPSRVIVISPPGLKEQLWALEQVLRSGSAVGALSWFMQQQPGYADLRRLQLAARQHATATLLVRHARQAGERSPAALRLQLSARAEQLDIHILKQHGGWSGQRLSISRESPAGWRSVQASMLPVPPTPAPPRGELLLPGTATLERPLPQQREHLH